VRLIIENGVILGILAEQDGRILKGVSALRLLKEVGEGAACVMYRISRDILESFKVT
jgi:hypothetical protein